MKKAHEESFLNIAEQITNGGYQRGQRFVLDLTIKTPKTMLKHLAEYGVLDVWTVREIGWQSTHDVEYYSVALTQKGIDYLTGNLSDVEKPCNCDSKWGYPYICKRHGDTRAKQV